MTELFGAYVVQTKRKLTESGFNVGSEKIIPYGEQFQVTDNVETLPVSLYEGKKGFSAVVGGRTGALKSKIQGMLGIASASVAETVGVPSALYGFEAVADFDGCWVGSDESGKGDVFGPLVVAGVMLDFELLAKLKVIGVRDCKTLSDKKVRLMASAIREVAVGFYRELELGPTRYNELYVAMQKEGKNLNHLLAWAHVRVLEDLLAIKPCKFAIIDQFANARIVESRLMAKGRNVTVIQKPKAENNIAVAAASILARDRFIGAMEELGRRFAVELPKGAGPAVQIAIDQFVRQHGKTALSQVGKLHFKTFEGTLTE